ncbi:MAG: hypothetical protein J6L73_02580 [Muribaculaceae bacterium]|nr:hypothetical protein [Muribaculaceae bacterium]
MFRYFRFIGAVLCAAATFCVAAAGEFTGLSGYRFKYANLRQTGDDDSAIVTFDVEDYEMPVDIYDSEDDLIFSVTDCRKISLIHSDAEAKPLFMATIDDGTQCVYDIYGNLIFDHASISSILKTSNEVIGDCYSVLTRDGVLIISASGDQLFLLPASATGFGMHDAGDDQIAIFYMIDGKYRYIDCYGDKLYESSSMIDNPEALEQAIGVDVTVYNTYTPTRFPASGPLTARKEERQRKERQRLEEFSSKVWNSLNSAWADGTWSRTVNINNDERRQELISLDIPDAKFSRIVSETWHKQGNTGDATFILNSYDGSMSETVIPLAFLTQGDRVQAYLCKKDVPATRWIGDVAFIRQWEKPGLVDFEYVGPKIVNQSIPPTLEDLRNRAINFANDREQTAVNLQRAVWTGVRDALNEMRASLIRTDNGKEKPAMPKWLQKTWVSCTPEVDKNGKLKGLNKDQNDTKILTVFPDCITLPDGSTPYYSLSGNTLTLYAITYSDAMLDVSDLTEQYDILRSSQLTVKLPAVVKTHQLVFDPERKDLLVLTDYTGSEPRVSYFAKDKGYDKKNCPVSPFLTTPHEVVYLQKLPPITPVAPWLPEGGAPRHYKALGREHFVSK